MVITFGEFWFELSESRSELLDPDWTPDEQESIELRVFSSISVNVRDS